jgi:hypothetical protein
MTISFSPKRFGFGPQRARRAMTLTALAATLVSAAGFGGAAASAAAVGATTLTHIQQATPTPGPVFAPTGLPGQTNLPDTNTFLRGSPVYMASGRPFTLEQAIALAKSTDLVVDVPQDLGGYVPAMKAANPNLKVLVYLNGTFAQHSQLNSYPSAEYMRNASGGVVESGGWGNYLMQFEDTTWQNDRAATCQSLIATGPGYDGCFIDMVGSGALIPNYLDTAPINPATGQVWTVTDWTNNVATLLQTIRAANPGAIIEGNGIDDGPRWFDPSLNEQLMASNVNIVMAEEWLIDSADSLDYYEPLSAWQQDVDAVQAVDASGEAVEATTKTWGTGTPAEIAQWHSFALASFMLATGGHSYFSFLPNTLSGTWTDSPLEHQNIGEPLGAYGYSDGAYVRYFSEGLAIVNPGLTTVTYTLPAGTYTGEDGTVYAATITLPPHTGHVLSLAPAITSTQSATTIVNTNGTFTVTATGSPTPSLTESGALPAGVAFSDNGNGTATITGTPSALGDYPIILTASNGNGPDATQNFLLMVPNAPAAAITSPSAMTATAGSPFSFTVSTTGSPVPTLSRTGSLPEGVTFTNNHDGTATIAGTPNVNASGVFTSAITAKNTAGTATQNLAITVDQAPSITGPSNATGATGTPFFFTVTTKGYPAADISVSSLPAGLAFTDNGNGTATINGTPTAGGTFASTLTATNGTGTATKVLAITVRQAPVIQSPDTASGTVGNSFNLTLTITGSPQPYLSRTGTLPGGLTFTNHDNGTATITGKPSVGGVFSSTIVAQNTAGRTTQNLVLTVGEAPTITSWPATTAITETPFSYTVTTKGFPAADISVSSLPAGLTLTDNGNGTASISGTPTAGGTFAATLTATNGNGTVTQKLIITVHQPPAIQSSATATATVGSEFSFSVITIGYPTPYLTKTGNLPAGVIFSTHGAGNATIAGTPKDSGTYTVAITAKNSEGSKTQSFTLTVQ